MKEKFMRYLHPGYAPLRKIAESACLSGATLMMLFATGCGSNTTSGTTPATPAAPAQGPQTYFSPYVVGTTNGSAFLRGPEIYSIDDFANNFSQSTFGLTPPQQEGPQVINAGVTSLAKRNLLDLGITANYTVSNAIYVATNFIPPKQGSFAVELAGQAGGLVQLVGQPAAPLVAAVGCPTSKTAQTYEFITIPAGLVDSSKGQQAASWDPKVDTAYGTVDISSNGSAVTFDNIHQYTLGSGMTAQQPSSPVPGACGSTVFGNTITVGQLIVKTPGGPGGQSVPPQASVGIGPTGLLVEHNGAADANAPFPGTSPGLLYDNTLGAGTGAVGLPKPSSAIDTGGLRGAQYLGFVYGSGVFSLAGPPTGWSSHLASFGFSNSPVLPSACSSFAAQTGPLVNGIYGGDFQQTNGQDDPSLSSDGFGNCNLAIDLGAQDSANNGLFPKATVWLGANFAANTTKSTYSFPAVAIAGQLNGKNAIFLIGVDSTQPWAIYLLQSN
jgi:hypothetical protein